MITHSLYTSLSYEILANLEANSIFKASSSFKIRNSYSVYYFFMSISGFSKYNFSFSVSSLSISFLRIYGKVSSSSSQAD